MKSATQADAASGFQFEASMSKEVLRSFASRAITHQGLCVVGTSPDPIFEEDLRMVCNMGAKYIGRAAFYSWSGNMTAEQIDTHYRLAKERAAAVHAVDPEIILQAGIFEIAYEQTVNNTVIPAQVFEIFGVPAETRTFRYRDMVFPAGTRDVLYGMDTGIGCWGDLSSGVPDITQLETKMYFYHCITRYIDAGYEAFHMGQAEKMMRYQGNDDAHHWDAVLAPARAYAKTHARRGLALFDNHDALDSTGIMIGDRLLFDMQGAGMVPDETVQEDGVQKCRITHYDDCRVSWIGRSGGGRHPLGFDIEENFTIIEFDNYGPSSHPGVSNPQEFFPWGYDDVTWFALQPEWYRNQFLLECDAYLSNTGKILDSEGKQQYFLQPVCRRVVTAYPTMLYKPSPNCDLDAVLRYLKMEKTEVADNGDGSYTLTVKGDYRANTQSDICPNGGNQENTIRKIFMGR